MMRCLNSFSCRLGFYDTQTIKMFGHGSVILYCTLISYFVSAILFGIGASEIIIVACN